MSEKFWIRKGHNKWFKHRESLSLKEIIDTFYYVCNNGKMTTSDYADYLEMIDPADVINTNIELASNKINNRYRGGLEGGEFKKLISSIRDKGVIKPILLHEVKEWHHFWKRMGKHMDYTDGKYNAIEGRHRVISCKILNEDFLHCLRCCLVHFVIDVPDANASRCISFTQLHIGLSG